MKLDSVSWGFICYWESEDCIWNAVTENGSTFGVINRCLHWDADCVFIWWGLRVDPIIFKTYFLFIFHSYSISRNSHSNDLYKKHQKRFVIFFISSESMEKQSEWKIYAFAKKNKEFNFLYGVLPLRINRHEHWMLFPYFFLAILWNGCLCLLKLNYDSFEIPLSNCLDFSVEKEGKSIHFVSIMCIRKSRTKSSPKIRIKFCIHMAFSHFFFFLISLHQDRHQKFIDFMLLSLRYFFCQKCVPNEIYFWLLIILMVFRVRQNEL
jgi:hypothetical protein